MSHTGKPVRKIFFVVGGMGLKPDKDFRIVDAGPFTKASRKMKATSCKK